MSVSAAHQYGLSSPVVYVIGRDVAKRFVISTRVVVGDKPPDLVPQIVGILPDDAVDLLLARPMIALDLSVRLRVVRRGKDMPLPLGFQGFPVQDFGGHNTFFCGSGFQ